MSVEFDAIVCGSGITGGWAAKELTQRGLKVLMVERGPNLEHRVDYTYEFTPPWQLPYRGLGDPKALATSKRHQKHARMNEWTLGLFVDDDVEVYETPPESDFQWLRGYHLGGRSVMWGRQCYRLAQHNLDANAQDGHGTPWPVRYDEIAPWYDYVERFVGVNGTVEDWPTLPDGRFQPSMGFNAGEQLFADAVRARFADRRVFPGRVANLTEPIGERGVCQNRSQCARGCSFGAYFCTQSATLPAARATGKLTLLTDSIAASLVFDPAARRVTGVRTLDARTGAGAVRTARIVFLCTGSVNSLSLLLRSESAAAPAGLGNSSDLLGRQFMDHCFGGLVLSTLPGLADQMYLGRKPNGFIIPRFVNIAGQQTDFLRGYSYQGLGMRGNWSQASQRAGIGRAFKESIRHPGPWTVGMAASVECIPRKENRVSLNRARLDRHGLPLTRIDVRWSDNERNAAAHAREESRRMLGLCGGHIFLDEGTVMSPGMSIHEMGGAPMGDDPRLSVTNRWNQLHDAPNVFVTDGAFMNSTGDRNPSLTYMAFTARAAARAADLWKQGAL
ncbi:MAG: GMC family oxidoreductase [Gammaproteobacteria bacterium]|nr:GMC family oxidoreductase [Gammaproteobacteria bacterium]